MMKRRLIFCIALFSIGGAATFAQSFFFFGLGGGAFVTLPNDFDTRAIEQWIWNGSSAVSLYQYRYFQYSQSGYLLDENDQLWIPPVASFFLVYETKRFAFQTGAELMYNVQENFMVQPAENEPPVSVVYYTYSAISIPLLANFYFISSPKFKMGVSVGSYFLIPLGDVVKTLPKMSGTEPEDIFRHDDNPAHIYRSYTHEIKQDFSGGLRFSLLSEFTIGKGALSIELGYQRGLFGGVDPMLINYNLSGEAPIENTERKITIMSGARIVFGYKFKIMLKGAAAEQGADFVDLSSGNYYLIVADQVEGPLSLGEVREYITKRVVKRDSKMWKKGLTDWVAAETFSELNNLFLLEDAPAGKKTP